MLLAGGKELPEPLQVGKEMYSDTIPLKDRTGSFTDSDTKNPFDLKDPKVIEQTIESVSYTHLDVYKRQK